jgi:hypothetical protein
MAMQRQTFSFLKKIAHAIPPDPDSEYRYVLYRSLDGEEWDLEHEDRCTVLFILLNPSKASADTTDPTIDKLMKYARAWGYERLAVVNLFAYRETESKKLRSLAKRRDLVGPENDHYISGESRMAHRVVCGWGNEGDICKRGAQVRELLESYCVDLYCFNQNQNGTPCHPLYQRDDAELVRLK